MPETNETLTELVNASGFLFQLRVEHEIKTAKFDIERRWKVIAREHRWVDNDTGSEGFIDLILSLGYFLGYFRAVLECKRVKEGNWIFLLERNDEYESRSRLLWTYQTSNQKGSAGFDDFNINPPSAESFFCVVRGTGERDTPMLERISGILLRSVENFANQELALRKNLLGEPKNLYLPIIVTNANLFRAYVDPSTIDLSTGQIPDTEFKPTQFIRFRKNLSTTHKLNSNVNNIDDANKLFERTIFIINSKHLIGFLDRVHPYPANRDDKFPWEKIIPV